MEFTNFEEKDYIINLYRTHYTVSNYKLGDIPELEHSLSIYNIDTHKYVPYYSYDSELKELYIPRGFPIHTVQKFFNHITIREIYEVSPYRKVIFNMKLTPRNDAQKKCIRYLTGKEEYYYTQNLPQLALILPGGGGKTYCVVHAMSYLNTPTLIITHNSDIRNQWEDRLLQYTNLSKKSIVVFTSSNIMDEYLNTSKKIDKKISQEAVYIVTHDLLQSYIKRYGKERFNQLIAKLGIGIKVIDEVHKKLMSTIKLDSIFNIKYNFYLTATFGRTDKQEDRLFHNIFNEVNKLKIDEEELKPEKDNVIYIAHMINTKPYRNDIDRMFTGRVNPKFSVYRYIDYELNLPYIKEALEFWYKYLMNKKVEGTVAIISPTKSSCNYFRDLLKDKFKDKKCAVHTSDEKVENIEDYDVICATSKMIGTGNDINGLVAIINMEPMSSLVNVDQLVHRLMRGNDSKARIYIEIIDKGVPNVFKMYQKRKKTIYKYVNRNILYEPK